MTPYFDDGGIVIYHGDCRDVLPRLGPVDHAICDPPYSEHVHGKQRRGGNRHRDGVVCEGRELGFDALTDDVRRFCGAWFSANVERWIAVFSDTESAGLWRDMITVDYVRTAFWRKVGGAPQFTGDRPAVACEAITLCHRPGRKRWNGGGKQGFYDVPIVVGHGLEGRYHTTQKPIELMTQLICDFTDPGDLILDSFMGSGTTLAAAKRLGRRAIGIELNEKYCYTAAKRLQQGALDLFQPDVKAETAELGYGHGV